MPCLRGASSREIRGAGRCTVSSGCLGCLFSELPILLLQLKEALTLQRQVSPWLAPGNNTMLSSSHFISHPGSNLPVTNIYISCPFIPNFPGSYVKIYNWSWSYSVLHKAFRLQSKRESTLVTPMLAKSGFFSLFGTWRLTTSQNSGAQSASFFLESLLPASPSRTPSFQTRKGVETCPGAHLCSVCNLLSCHVGIISSSL